MTSNPRNLVFVAPVPTLSKRTRLAKFAECYLRDGYAISHIAWLREPAEEADTDRDLGPVSRQIVLVGGGYGRGRRLGLHYLRWSFSAGWALRRHKGATVHALGLESALPAVVANLFRLRLSVIYDDADRLSLCHSFPKPVRAMIQAVERWTAKRSTVQVVPSTARYPDGLPAPRSLEIKNTPSRTALSASATQPSTDRPSFVLYVNGWIGEERGAGAALELARHFADDERFGILAAGRLTGPSAAALVEMPNVDYQGEVPNEVALAYYRMADLVLTLYDPSIEINRYAEPNKWGDCMTSRTPFLVNTEVVTARPFIAAGVALAAPYNDVAQMIKIVAQAIDHRSELQNAFDDPAVIDLVAADFDAVVEGQLVPLLKGL